MAQGVAWNRAAWQWVAIAGGLTAFVLLAVVLWRHVFPDLTSQDQFRLSESNLIVTAQPEWIYPSTNVKREVIRDNSLEKISLWDDQAVMKVARAFELHPWVRRVVRVRKEPPGRVVVDIEYRRPIALVEVLYQNKLFYEPIDADGVVLPEDYFHHHPEALENFLRITVDYALPTGPVGTSWSDERVVGAAQLAAVLEPTWKKWNLFRIAAVSDEPADRHPVFELRTRGNSRIRWGHAVGKEPKGEPDARTKISWISQYVQEHGPLDASPSSSPVTLDVRSDSGLQVSSPPP